MDVEFFLKERTKFILYFYRNATLGFLEIIHAIENEEEPFVPPYSEDSEPPFLTEWMEAQTGLNSVGYAALSMLSASLALYLEEWTVRIENPQKKFKRKHKKGWFYAYKRIFQDQGMALETCPADLELIEQTVLARNRVQHPENIVQIEVHHSKKDLERHPSPFFLSEHEARMLNNSNLIPSWMTPKVSINEEKLKEVVHHVELLCSWLESQYMSVRNA